MLWCLRCQASIEGAVSSTPDLGGKIPHALWHRNLKQKLILRYNLHAVKVKSFEIHVSRVLMTL